MKIKTLSWQLGLSIAIFIFFIEGILLVTSIHSRKAELMNMKEVLQADVIKKTGKNFNDLHPDILDEKDIERRMNKFKRNVIILTVLISLVVISGTLIVFYFVAGRYLFKINKLNKAFEKTNSISDSIYKDTNLPTNEIGDLIKTRNKLLFEIEDYQNNLEEKLNLAKDQLVQAAKMSFVGEFTSSIVHDLKNPLAIVSMNSDLLMNNWESLDEEKKQKLISKTNLGVSRALEMIDRMGKFNRLSSNDFEKMNLNLILDNSLLFLKNKIIKNDIQIENLIENNLPKILGSSPAIEQVFSNLLSNGIDAMENSNIKTFKITSQVTNDQIFIEFTDSGCGIKKENLEHIFDSFFTTKSLGSGTGLGLSSVTRILNEHNAKISVTSEIDKGSTFKITFQRS